MKSYQKIHAIHKPEVAGILYGHINVEEKIDGSQFRIEISNEGIKCGSHHLELGDDSMFRLGTDNAKAIFKDTESANGETITVFGEYLSKPKQNQIPYERVPKHNIMIFDVMMGERYLDREEKERFAFLHDLEVVPLLWRGHGSEFTEEVREKLLKTKSILGHQSGYDRIEGIVIKNYDKTFNVIEGHSLYGHFMCTKIVNDSFKETKSIKNPKGDKLETLKESVCSEARWKKALQHCTESGELIHDMKDIGTLTRRVMTDLEEEEKETIKDQLYKMYGKEILKASVSGLSTWYQDILQNECL